MDFYADISHLKRFNVKPSTRVLDYHRSRLADKVSNFYCVPINDFSNLQTISDFAEYIKRYDMKIRLPEIEAEVRKILKHFFALREYAKDELIFQGIPDPLYTRCYRTFTEQVEKRFKINWYVTTHAEIFKRDFTLQEIVDWIYLNEKHAI